MTGTTMQEYRHLELESSNHLMEHDSREVLGRYEEAAYNALQAGNERDRMGQLSFEAQEYSNAAADWLSATACYLLATAAPQAKRTLETLRRLEADGKIPANRPDMRAALEERDRGLQGLKQKLQQFDHHVTEAKLGYPANAPDDHRLQSLLSRVPDLPGCARLHAYISNEAWLLGMQDLAAKHRYWAEKFAPSHPTFFAFLGYLHIVQNRAEEAIALGNKYLATCSGDAGVVRIMVAYALASDEGLQPPNQEQALMVLRPLLDNSDTDVRNRFVALALSAALLFEVGREREFRHLEKELESLAGTVHDSELHAALTDIRVLIPHMGVNGTGNARNSPGHLLPKADRLRLFQKAKQLQLLDTPAAA
jgi:hypothetical protein